MDYEKIVIGLASVLAGWLLAQFTGLFKELYRTYKVKKCLLEELEDLKCELERTLLIYSRQLQIYALKGIGNESPVSLSNHIFSNYYKDAVLGLNQQQRISYQLIHTLIGNVNRGMKELREMTSSLQEKNILEGKGSVTEQDGDYWGKKVICEFINVASAIWHIRYHLANPKNPDLSLYTENHETYLKYLENVEKKVVDILEKAKNLDREKFEKTYDPEAFAKDML